MALRIGHEPFGLRAVFDADARLLLGSAFKAHGIGVVDVFTALFHRRGLLVQARERGPRLVVGAARGLLRHDLQHRHILGALSDRRAQTVRTGVAATDDHDMLAFGGDVVHRLLAVESARGVR